MTNTKRPVPDDNPSRVSWDGRINFGMVLGFAQFLMACGLGFYAFGHIEAQMDSLTAEIAIIRTDLRSSLHTMQSQIDNSTKRTDDLYQRR